MAMTDARFLLFLILILSTLNLRQAMCLGSHRIAGAKVRLNESPESGPQHADFASPLFGPRTGIARAAERPGNERRRRGCRHSCGAARGSAEPSRRTHAVVG
ncbi:hypothetical protein F3J20_06285 [Paraburkholderia sp. Cy-641]|nr:hypothetical protein [Paraburkholderia sp. Cy-641]